MKLSQYVCNLHINNREWGQLNITTSIYMYSKGEQVNDHSQCPPPPSLILYDHTQPKRKRLAS